MPLEVKLTVRDDTFEVKADAMDATIVDLAKTWVTALAPASDTDATVAGQLAAVKAQVEGNTSTLSAAADQAA